MVVDHRDDHDGDDGHDDAEGDDDLMLTMRVGMMLTMMLTMVTMVLVVMTTMTAVAEGGLWGGVKDYMVWRNTMRPDHKSWVGVFRQLLKSVVTLVSPKSAIVMVVTGRD
eukprot:11330267-Karenia_brevis.AAC.1